MRANGQSAQGLRRQPAFVLHAFLLRDPLGGQGDGWLAGGLLALSEVFADGVQVVIELLRMGIPRSGGAALIPLEAQTR